MPAAFDDHRPPSASWSTTACTAASACRPARRTCCGARRWTRPRGRIYLMKPGLEGEPLTDSMVGHFDACLGLHGLRHRLPVRRAVRQADRGDPRAGRATPPRGRCAERAAARGDLRAVPATRGGCGCCAVRCALYQRSGLQSLVRRSGVLRPAPAALARDGGAAPPPVPGRAPAAAGAGRRARRRGGRRSACSPAACSARSSRGVNAATARVLAMEGCDVVIPREPGLLRRASACTTGARRRRRRSPADAIDVVRGRRRRPRRRQRGRAAARR